jgi:hypothetical protein
MAVAQTNLKAGDVVHASGCGDATFTIATFHRYGVGLKSLTQGCEDIKTIALSGVVLVSPTRTDETPGDAELPTPEVAVAGSDAEKSMAEMSCVVAADSTQEGGLRLTERKIELP